MPQTRIPLNSQTPGDTPKQRQWFRDKLSELLDTPFRYGDIELPDDTPKKREVKKRPLPVKK